MHRLTVIINGQEQVFEGAHDLSEILADYKPAEPFAVMLNDEFIARSNYADVAIKEGDCIEVISAIQGG